MKPKVLVSDKLSEQAVQMFLDRGVDVDFKPNLGKDKSGMLSVIGDYDGLAVRSTTKVSGKLLDRAKRLKVIGRAGIGVDNVDVAEATRKGIIVMNTPFGNSITTAEHAIAMMLSVARQIPEACASTRSGKWEKSRFTGTELLGKTLGVIGCGNIGSAVCSRAIGLEMKVVGYDPYLSYERAQKLGIEKVELEELIAKADFITLHVPLTVKTRNILDERMLSKTKPGVRIINCARGGIVDEVALATAIRSGHVAGAAIDVFAQEPPAGNPLLDLPEVVATPHLGASTMEAQEKVAQQIAEQMSDYLVNGAVSNAINMPSFTAEEAKDLLPWLNLASYLGSFVGQVTHEPIKSVNVLYDGSVAKLNTDALSAAVATGILKASNPETNMVSADVMARERGIVVSKTTSSQSGVFESYIKLNVETDLRQRSIAGTVFSDDKPRFIQIKGIYVDAEIDRHMLYVTNKDTPGMIGWLGTALGENGINIANFHLGRSGVRQDAIALLSLDSAIDAKTLAKLKNSELFPQVHPLKFEVEASAFMSRW